MAIIVQETTTTIEVYANPLRTTSPWVLDTTICFLELYGDLNVSILVYPKFNKSELVFNASVNNGTKSRRVSAEMQSFTPDNIVELYEIDLVHIGMGILRFCPYTNEQVQPLKWGGNIYVPWPIQLEGIERSAQGSASRPTLKAGAVLPEMTSLLIGKESILGSKVTRIRTFRRFLDDGDEPSTTDHFPYDVYRIERISEWIAGVSVSFELANPLDMESAMFPKRQIIRDYCYWRYRIWDNVEGKFIYSKYSPCPYAGNSYFDKNNKSVAHPSLDKCNKMLSGCKLRFGANATLPFGGCPGAAPKNR